MTDSKNPADLLSRFARQFAAQAGPGFESLNAELRQQIRNAAQSAFEKMDFVPREEFEAQKAVLLRTREKLENLEKQLAELESRIDQQNATQEDIGQQDIDHPK